MFRSNPGAIVTISLTLRKLAFFILVMMPARAKSSENATSAAAIRGDFMTLISAVRRRHLEKEIGQLNSNRVAVTVAATHAENQMIGMHTLLHPATHSGTSLTFGSSLTFPHLPSPSPGPPPTERYVNACPKRQERLTGQGCTGMRNEYNNTVFRSCHTS